MFDRLKNLYKDGKVTEEGLRKALKAGWITTEEFNIIILNKN